MLKAIKQARTAFSLLNPDEVRRLAGRSISFGLVAMGGRQYAEMEDFLIPAGVGRKTRMELIQHVHRAGDAQAPDHVDLVLYQDGIEGPKGTYTFCAVDPERTVREIVEGNDDIAVSLARQYPAFRKPVVDGLIHSVARENAFFALATALPDVIPSLMELPWAFGEFASDTTFMTANQVRMAFLIAAACGKEAGFGKQKAEILAIAAGAFGWRAIARELAGKIPFGGGLIPKGAIAYAATFAIGKGLERLYHAGAPYTRQEREEAFQLAYERGKSVVQEITAGARASGGE
ncbi:MAG: hypothetical protein ABSF25_24630 [Bryobacteraceae bacterium]|jgi:hypothetical protein